MCCKPLEPRAGRWLLGVTSGSPSPLVLRTRLASRLQGVGDPQSSVGTSASAKGLVGQTVIPQHRARVKMLQWKPHLLQDRPNCNLAHHPGTYLELEYLTCGGCTLSSPYWTWCPLDYLVKKAHKQNPAFISVFLSSFLFLLLLWLPLSGTSVSQLSLLCQNVAGIANASAGMWVQKRTWGPGDWRGCLRRVWHMNLSMCLTFLWFYWKIR